MAWDAAQTARLQSAVDALPSCLFAEDMIDVTKRLASTMTFDDPSWNTEELTSNLTDLKLVGERLQNEGGDPPNPAHSNIAGLYCKGSDGYTDFLRAYAGAYRAWDSVMQAKRSEGNWAGQLIEGTKKFFKDVGSGVSGLARDSLTDVFKGLWPVFALIGGILLVIVIVAVVTKGKISVR